MSTNLTIATMATLGIAAVFAAAPANAADTDRQEITQATDVCQPATFTVAKVRNRPSGVRNESTGGLYMTCAMMSDSGSGRDDYEYYVRVTNQGASTQTVNCTMIDGFVGSVYGAYPQSDSVASGDSKWFYWKSADLNGGTAWAVVGFSCLLQPNVEINYFKRYYKEDIGA